MFAMKALELANIVVRFKSRRSIARVVLVSKNLDGTE